MDNGLRYLSGCGYIRLQKFSMGLLDFNKQLEILVPKPGKELLQIPQAFNKTDVFVGIYAISEDLDSKYVFADLGLAQELLEYKSNQISELRSKKQAKLMKLQS
jgi:lipoprotein-releasing system permease protein